MLDNELKKEIQSCTVCKNLPLGPRPVVQFSSASKILLVGQAPGRRVHETGIPFNDPSGDRLRHWLGVERDIFYDDDLFAIVPMGFCYPGTGTSGDLPPRPECADTWRNIILKQLQQVQLTIVIGRYAIDYHLPNMKSRSVTQVVSQWSSYWPQQIVLPHPSPRNNRWLKNNPWFEQEVIPVLQQQVVQLID